ncbi:hypothetical protein CP04DC42_1095, partial [Chlamydia psittaci 04DC42]
MLYQGLV